MTATVTMERTALGKVAAKINKTKALVTLGTIGGASGVIAAALTGHGLEAMGVILAAAAVGPITLIKREMNRGQVATFNAAGQAVFNDPRRIASRTASTSGGTASKTMVPGDVAAAGSVVSMPTEVIAALVADYQRTN